MSQGRKKSNRDSKKIIESDVTGVVKRYIDTGGYGFITEDVTRRNVFFHISAAVSKDIRRRDDPIRAGDEVIYNLYQAPKGFMAESVRILNQESSESDDSDDLHRRKDSRIGLRGRECRSGGRGGNRRGGSVGRVHELLKDWSDWSTENQHSSTGPGPEPQPQPRHPTCTCSNGGRGKVKDTKPETSTSSNPTSGWDHVKAEHTVRENTQPHVTPPNSTELSGSAKQRERGNIFYKSATEDFSATVRIIRLENAITCYKNALSCSSNRDDEASASKNIGMASWKLATIALESETEESEKRQQSILKHFKEALKFFCTAYVLRSYKSASWGDKLVESWENCLEEACEWLAMLDTAERVAGFSELLGYLPDCSLKANGYIQYSTLLFHEGLTAWQDGEYKECYRFMRECYFPVQEAERLCEGDCSIKSEIAVLQEDVYIHTCVAESSMARATGDDLLEEHLKNEETVNTNIIWTVIDFYTQAAMLCRDKDLEQEAIAYSRLGRVYGKVLTLPSRGKDYYKKAIQLALSMTPRTFHGVGWFMESTKFVEDFQKRLNKDEEEDKDKEAALEEMKEDVDRLSEMATNHGDLEFVKDIYKTWPPKAPGAKLNEKLSTKKLLLKAISHYHPDKVDKEVHGKNWFYFSGEITRHLNSKYACQKGVE
eukprot:XP_011663284.1 PREDICTED: uncharacterized protein LOC100890018 isoform X3 [Strongylocentrotus purpuratus]